MLSGEVPFNSITTHRTAEDIVEDITRSKLSYDTPAWKNVSQAAKDLVKGKRKSFVKYFTKSFCIRRLINR
jgi:hypothetical protein